MQTSRYIVKRILLALVSLFAIITITYFLMNLMPGDPLCRRRLQKKTVRSSLPSTDWISRCMCSMENTSKISCTGIWNQLCAPERPCGKDIIFESFQVSMGLGVRALLLAIVCGIILAVSQGSVRISCRMRSSVSFRRLEFRCLVMSSLPADDFPGGKLKGSSGQLQ